MIATRMKNASYNDAVAFDPVKELVRKAAHEHATKTAIVNGIALRIANQSLERSFDFGDELGAQSNALTPRTSLGPRADRSRPAAEW